MSSALISNSDRSKRNKKKKLSVSQSKESQQNQTRWKSDAQQQIYSSKLIQALNHVSGSGSGAGASPSAPRRGRAVREAADRVLAVAAKGRTRWSRAILTNRLKLKFRKHKKVKKITAPPAAVTGSNRSKKAGFTVLRLKAKSLPAVQRKVRVLGRLVPGCRKQPLPVILEEASDYIAALEMQVRAMSALAELLSRGSSSGNGAAADSTPPAT